MAFQLNSVVPRGRKTEEYCAMFQLDESARELKIAGFGDGPACPASNGLRLYLKRTSGAFQRRQASVSFITDKGELTMGELSKLPNIGAVVEEQLNR